MNWAQPAIDALRAGQVCNIVPHGNSMRPRILSGATVTLAPLGDIPLYVEDVVLVDIPEADGKPAHTTLHMVVGVAAGDTSHVHVGDMRGNIDGWIPVENVHGRVVSVRQPVQSRAS